MVQLVRQIVNFLEGSPCFLCQTTEGRECIWDEIGMNSPWRVETRLSGMKQVRDISCDIPPLPKVIMLHDLHATAITFTLPALGPLVPVISESQLAWKTTSDAFSQEMVSLLGSMTVLLAMQMLQWSVVLLAMRMVLRCEFELVYYTYQVWIYNTYGYGYTIWME